MLPLMGKRVMLSVAMSVTFLPAESSITFDDVTVVINSCRVNVASFDPVNNMPQLGPQVGGVLH
jgi:hypothetical protein